MNADLDTRTTRRGPEGTSTRVANFADGYGRVTQVHLAVLDLEIVLVCRDALVDTDLGLRCTVVLDLNFEIEGCNTLECDWDNFLAFRFTRAKTVCLAGLVEASVRARVDLLLDRNRREVLLRVIIPGICEFEEGVLVGTSL